MPAPTTLDIETCVGETPDDLAWTFTSSIAGTTVRLGIGTAPGLNDLAAWRSDGQSPALLIAGNGLSVTVDPTVVTGTVTATWAARRYDYQLWVEDTDGSDHPYYEGAWVVRAGHRVAP